MNKLINLKIDNYRDNNLDRLSKSKQKVSDSEADYI